MEINDDSLYAVYMTDKNVSTNDKIFDMGSYKYYYIWEDTYMCVPANKSENFYQIFNMHYKKAFTDSIQIIKVDQKDGSISFYTRQEEKDTLKIKAEFDKDHYDVRSYKDTPRKPTYLKEALEELNEDDKEGFTNLIYASTMLAKLKKEKKK